MIRGRATAWIAVAVLLGAACSSGGSPKRAAPATPGFAVPAPYVPPYVPPVVPRAFAQAIAQPVNTTYDDLLALTRAVGSLNAAFGRSVTEGITTSTAVNYWVAANVYTAGQCIAFETNRSRGQVRAALYMRPYAFVPSPGWVDPVIGLAPQGRVYSVGFDEIETWVPTGQTRRSSFIVHVTVLDGSQAKLFLRCQ